MEDISPKLLEQIQTEFDKAFNSSKQVTKIYELILMNKADFSLVHEFSILIGEMLEEVIAQALKVDYLPNGTLYQNIAEKVFKPVLKENYELVTDVSVAVQELLYANKGIGLKAIAPEYPADRIEGIIINSTNNNGLGADVITTFSQSIVDAAIEANYSFSKSAGISPTPKRIVMGNCCDWCKEVAGKVDPDADLYEIGFFRRHKSCRCLTLMDYGKKGYSSVYSKQKYKTVEEAMDGEHTYLKESLDKLSETERRERKNALYREYYRQKRLQTAGTYKKKKGVKEYAEDSNAPNTRVYREKLEKQLEERQAELKRLKSPEVLKKEIEDDRLKQYRDKDISNQSINQLEKGIKSFIKQKENHLEKINHPEKYIHSWDKLDERRKNGLKRHWEKEVKNFDISIERRRKEIERRRS